MPRDYSSRRDESANNNGKRGTRKHSNTRSQTGKTRRRTPTSDHRRSNGSNGQRQAPAFTPGSPGCLWLVAAVLVLIVIGAVYYISRPASKPDTAEVDLSAVEQDDSDHASADKDRDDEEDDQDKDQQRFSFYKSLPNYKVKVEDREDKPTPVANRRAARETETATNLPSPKKVAQNSHDPDDDKATDQSREQDTSSTSNTSDKPDDSSNDPDKADDSDKRFVIQAGAFSSKADADQRKARLEDLDTPASVSEIQTDDGDTIYRVHSDPISPRDKARALADKLESNDIENFVQEAS